MATVLVTACVHHTLRVRLPRFRVRFGQVNVIDYEPSSSHKQKRSPVRILMKVDNSLTVVLKRQTRSIFHETILENSAIDIKPDSCKLKWLSWNFPILYSLLSDHPLDLFKFLEQYLSLYFRWAENQPERIVTSRVDIQRRLNWPGLQRRRPSTISTQREGTGRCRKTIYPGNVVRQRSTHMRRDWNDLAGDRRPIDDARQRGNFTRTIFVFGHKVNHFL